MVNHTYSVTGFMSTAHRIRESGTAFCMLNYACWSAPLNDLSAWRCEGSIYRPEQDPQWGESGRYLYAPDVVRGNDGRYYLYYALSGGNRFTQPIHVAVCDTPCGKFSYYGRLQNPDGSEFTRFITFDPGVINDDGRIWLYYGWSVGVSQMESFILDDREECKFLMRYVS